MTTPHPDPAARLRAAAENVRNGNAAIAESNLAWTIAEWLDAAADEMTAVDGTEYAASEYPSWIAALAVARALLGSQP